MTEKYHRDDQYFPNLYKFLTHLTLIARHIHSNVRKRNVVKQTNNIQSSLCGPQ
jgi:hypothetical protein